MANRHLVNADGTPFDPVELSSIRADLEALKDSQRKDFRNGNAKHLAQHAIPKMLVVSGPGTGKSTLFKQRILHWLNQNPEARILAVSFVRKLVADLAADIAGDARLTDEQKKQVEVLTLHGYARSLVEKNHGTRKTPFRPHFKIIGQSWKDVVWSDVLHLVGQTSIDQYSWKMCEHQFHSNKFYRSTAWKAIYQGYSTLCSFYNASGFADLIVRARRAVEENPALEENHFFIVDEYQDFNRSEELLINEVTQNCHGILVVGDDDQVLYETLKAGNAALIRALYNDPAFGKGMLPFCGRCGKHIVGASAHFLSQNKEEGCIEKIYLPLETEVEAQKVSVIGCAAPQSAVYYVRQFMDEHKGELEERREKLKRGEEKDAFLLILTPSREVRFYGKATPELFGLVSEYRQDRKSLSEDYYKLLCHYALGKRPEDNFNFRKVLYYEGVDPERVAEVIRSAIAAGKQLCELDEPEIGACRDKATKTTAILNSACNAEEQVSRILPYIKLDDSKHVTLELAQYPIGAEEGERTGELQEEEEAELAELEVQRMSAVELLTIVGAKGLSADHVIILGFDNVNMAYVSKNAFYVAMTRARRSLHLITALGSGGSQGPSPYLNDLPDEHLMFYKCKKSEKKVVQMAGRSSLKEFLEYMAKVKRRTG